MNEKIKEWIDDCVSAATCSNSPFSKWEHDFIDSVSEWFEENQMLTDKQLNVLERIWNKI